MGIGTLPTTTTMHTKLLVTLAVCCCALVYHVNGDAEPEPHKYQKGVRYYQYQQPHYYRQPQYRLVPTYAQKSKEEKKDKDFFKDLKGLIKGLFKGDKGDKDKGKGKGKGYVQYVPVHQQPHYQTYTPQYQTQSYYHTDSYDYE